SAVVRPRPFPAAGRTRRGQVECRPPLPELRRTRNTAPRAPPAATSSSPNVGQSQPNWTSSPRCSAAGPIGVLPGSAPAPAEGVLIPDAPGAVFDRSVGVGDGELLPAGARLGAGMVLVVPTVPTVPAVPGSTNWPMVAVESSSEKPQSSSDAACIHCRRGSCD